MGITTEDFFRNIYNAIFSPKLFYESDNEIYSVRLAIGVISTMAVINKIAHSIVDNSVYEFSFLFGIIGSIICSIIIWFLIALFFEYIAKIFDKGGQLKKLLYLSAFSSIPAIFTPPLILLKQVGELGYILAVILGCFLYIWILTLYAYSLKSTYSITFARAFMLIFLPLISSIPAIYQIVGLYNNICYIFSI